LTGRSRATHYRRLRPPVLGPKPPRPSPPSRLPEPERAAVLALLNAAEHADLAPAQIWARELDSGRYHCSISTMYRILREHDQVGERRRQARHPANVKPELQATGPNQVWSWDVTRLRSGNKGSYFHLYVMLDIFSRKAICWRVALSENAVDAGEFIEASVAANGGIRPGWVHADRGSAMTAGSVADLMTKLAITRSHSRPKTSNDNPYSEAQFRTLKYDPWFPDAFIDLAAAIEYVDAYLPHYNHVHRHSGIGWHTPASVHHGTAELVRDQRQAVLNAAWAANPERFARRPAAPKIPDKVWINNPEVTQRQPSLPAHLRKN
jgi:transposase InsO family protein